MERTFKAVQWEAKGGQQEQRSTDGQLCGETEKTLTKRQRRKTYGHLSKTPCLPFPINSSEQPEKYKLNQKRKSFTFWEGPEHALRPGTTLEGS